MRLVDKYKGVQTLELYTSLFRGGETIREIVAPYQHWKLIERDDISGDVVLCDPHLSSKVERLIILCGALGVAWTRWHLGN